METRVRANNELWNVRVSVTNQQEISEIFSLWLSRSGALGQKKLRDFREMKRLTVKGYMLKFET
jgi:hypothetical protein